MPLVRPGKFPAPERRRGTIAPFLSVRRIRFLGKPATRPVEQLVGTRVVFPERIPRSDEKQARHEDEDKIVPSQELAPESKCRLAGGVRKRKGNKRVAIELVVPVVNVDEEANGGHIVPETGEIACGMWHAGPMVDRVYDCPANGARRKSSGDRPEGDIEEATDRWGRWGGPGKPCPNGVRVKARAPKRRDSRYEIRDNQPKVSGVTFTHVPGVSVGWESDRRKMPEQLTRAPLERIPGLGIGVHVGRLFHR